MGSKKKRESSESSSSSDSSSSDSSAGRSKPNNKKEVNKSTESNSDVENEKKSTKKAKTESKMKKDSSPVEEEPENRSHKGKPERRPLHGGYEAEKEDRRRRRRSPSQDNRDRKFRDDRRMKDRFRYEDRRNRNNDRFDNRYRGRRPDYRNRDRRDERDYRYRRDDNRSYNRDRDQRRRSRSASFDHGNAKWGKEEEDKKTEKKDNKEKQKPNFSLSGKLTEETNTFRGVVIKYSEPPEARKPKRRWRLYPFKGERALQTLYIHRESAYLIGRERKVVDLPVDHPSCSKQHAVLQYRLVPFTREDGTVGKRVRPYLIDLNSANGTFINNKKIEPSKYVELLEKDVIKFGYSSREYVLLHENSKDEAQDDDVKQEDEEVVVKNEAG